MRLLQKIQAKVNLNKNLLFILLAIIILVIFEKILYHNDLRFLLPQDVSDSCDCLCTLSSRAWYLKINFAHILMLVIAPVRIFSVSPKQNKWIRSLYIFIVLAFGYFLAKFGSEINYFIKNGPFDRSYIYFDSEQRKNCMDLNVYIGSSFYTWFSIFVIYCGINIAIWERYHRKVTKLIKGDFKRDVTTNIIFLFTCLVSIVYMIMGVLILLQRLF